MMRIKYFALNICMLFGFSAHAESKLSPQPPL